MDSFIIFRSAIEPPLNLNYLILREMADVKNHKFRASRFGALLTKIFAHFRVSFRSQHDQHIDRHFTEHLISRGISLNTTDNEESEEEGYEAQSWQIAEMDVDNSSHNKEIPPGPSTYEAPPQDAPPNWYSFMENFGYMTSTMTHLGETMARIEQCQERHEQYFDQLGDNYEQLYQHQMEFNWEYHAQMTHLESQMEQLAMDYAPRPPHPPPSS
ncbi:hypothetical protein Acr_25g0001580 [Actinidia rufa]|uniref:Uncharacterized protein n=1 Tax=Actinidia rufa TaxID=165716 RepID=A0A7J0GY45_9ERIC|nr:hypothetical protein Acr_25g0001580 [Actinidia rufa]